MSGRSVDASVSVDDRDGVPPTGSSLSTGPLSHFASSSDSPTKDHSRSTDASKYTSLISGVCRMTPFMLSVNLFSFVRDKLSASEHSRLTSVRSQPKTDAISMGRI